MAKKATVAQKTQRVRVVYEFLLSDTPRPDIIEYSRTTWGVKRAATDNYIKAANDLIVEEAARMRENALEKHLAQRALIRNKALKEGDKRLAFDVLRDETKLLGLYPKGQGSSEDDPLVVKVIRVASDDLDWDSDDS